MVLAYPLATAPIDIDLDTASLRVVSGELTSRQDSLNLLQETNALWRTEYKHAIMTPATPGNRRALNGGDGADGSIKGADGGKQRYQREGDGEESGEESNLPANQTQAAADAEDDPDDLSSHPQGRDAFLTIYYSAANGRRLEGLTGHVLATKRLARIREVEKGFFETVVGRNDWVRSRESELKCVGQLGSSSTSPEDDRPASAGPVHMCPAIRTRISFGGIDPAVFDGFVSQTMHYLRGASNNEVEVSFDGSPFYHAIISAALSHDMSLFFVSIMLIFLILVLALGSMRLTCFALLSILICFPLAYGIFAAGFAIPKLPAMGLVSVFLILGIGVDAILVINTAYTRSLQRPTHTVSENLPGAESSTKSQKIFAELSEQDSSTKVMKPKSSSRPEAIAVEPSMAESDEGLVTASSQLSVRDDGPTVDNSDELEKQDDKKPGTDADGSGGQLQNALVLASAIEHALPITSIAAATTAVSFVAGLASPLVTIRQFSLFQLILVSRSAAERKLLKRHGLTFLCHCARPLGRPPYPTGDHQLWPHIHGVHPFPRH